MSNTKRTIVNLTSSLLVLITSVMISFVLSPYIVSNIGVEANGFVTLANNFVTYAQLAVTALNSMAARFITIEYVKKNYNKANMYYNSVFWGNLIIVGVVFIPATYFIINMENIISIPSDICLDVKILFAFIFFNFFLTTGLPNWDCGTYVSNRLDRKYIPQAITSVLRCIILIMLFSIFEPHVWYVGFGAFVVTVTILIVSCINTHKLTPELRVVLKPSRAICSWNAMLELVGTGIWNTISNIGNMLLSGLDLIICNVFIGPTEMGILALAKIIPNYMQQLSASIRNAFAPELTINYAKGDVESVKKDLLRAMKMTSMIMTVPIALIISCGDKFFSLWVPSQDARLLQVLSILSILGYAFTSGIQILYNVFSTVNKVKNNAIAMIISGIVSVLLTLMFVKYTTYGMFAVAGVSTFVNLVRNMTFTVPYTSKCLGFKWNTFFPQVCTTVVATLILIVCNMFIGKILKYSNWVELILSFALLATLGIVINMFILLNPEERSFFVDKLSRKMHLK